MHKTPATCGLLLLLSACTTTSNDYIVEDRTYVDQADATEAIKTSANATMAAHGQATVQQPVVVRAVAPKMPREAIDSGIQGPVRARLRVDRKGRVSEVEILESPHELLSEAVAKAMKQWLFSPRVIDGSPEPFSVEQTYKFEVWD